MSKAWETAEIAENAESADLVSGDIRYIVHKTRGSMQGPNLEAAIPLYSVMWTVWICFVQQPHIQKPSGDRGTSQRSYDLSLCVIRLHQGPDLPIQTVTNPFVSLAQCLNLATLDDLGIFNPFHPFHLASPKPWA